MSKFGVFIMTSENKRGKTKKCCRSGALEIRIPRVQEMESNTELNQKKVKISRLIVQADGNEDLNTAQLKENDAKGEAFMDHNDGEEIGKKLDLCHKKLQESNMLLLTAANSLKELDFNNLRKQILESKEIDTADCLLKDEEELERSYKLLQKRLETIKGSEKVKEKQESHNIDDSVKDLIETFSTIKERVNQH